MTNPTELLNKPDVACEFINDESEQGVDLEDLSKATTELIKTFDKVNFKNEQQVIFLNELIKSRKYNLETLPKVVYSRGSIVELLIKSGVGHALEFKMPLQSYVYIGDKLESVPSSKEDVFKDASIALIDKRRLMKFFTGALEFKDNGLITNEKTFYQSLKDQGINDNLIAVISSSIAFIDNFEDAHTIGFLDAYKKVQHYLQSIGRYGTGALLTALYGTGSELCQAFCRYSAVYGSCFILDFKLESITNTNQAGFAVKSADIDQVFHAKHLICQKTHLSFLQQQEHGATHRQRIHRIICISKTEFKCSEHSITVFPWDIQAKKSGIFAIHYTSENEICPDNTCIEH